MKKVVSCKALYNDKQTPLSLIFLLSFASQQLNNFPCRDYLIYASFYQAVVTRSKDSKFTTGRKTHLNQKGKLDRDPWPW
jgi:hypothetical protein